VTWQSERVIFRDIWADSLRLIVDGKDVTRFRGVLAQVGGYQLQRPYGYGPATFAFPGVTDLEELGVGELSWLRQEAPVRLVPVKNGVRQNDVWRGFIRTPGTSDGHVRIMCEGEASGRLAARIRPPVLFPRTEDAGYLVWGGLKACDVKLHPRLGPTTGIDRSTAGASTTYLDYINNLLSSLGDDWTVDPAWVDGRHRYRMVEVDTSTVDATVFCGTEGVSNALDDDLFEKPNTFFGTCVTPQGQKVVNAKAPGMVQGDPPPFPGVMQLGDVSDDVVVLQNRLLHMTAELDREDLGDDRVFDQATKEAVEAIQDDAGLTVNGIVNEATWNACFDLSATGLALRPGLVLPFAQASRVRYLNRTATGAASSVNPNHDPDAIQVDIMPDHGVTTKRRVRRWSRRQLERNETGVNLVGVLEFDGADLFVGDVTHATAGKTVLSRLDLRPGMRVRYRGYQGGNPVLTVVGVNVDGDMRVRAAVDSKARPLRTVGEIIAANRDTRNHPAREFKQSLRNRPAAIDNTVIFSELGGKLGTKVSLTGGRWTVFPVIMGKSGEVRKTRIRTQNAETRFVFGVFAQDIEASLLNARYPDPRLEASDWHKPAHQDSLVNNHLMIHSVGQHKQFAGYHPGQQADDDGPTGDPVTGLHVDLMTWPYFTFEDPVVYVAVWAESNSTIDAGRMFWNLETEGA
jgi:peptidoglycan hydrolase-like protein with peptidoglycan-binding domain